MAQVQGTRTIIMVSHLFLVLVLRVEDNIGNETRENIFK